mgnify:CR=1 FL=1
MAESKAKPKFARYEFAALASRLSRDQTREQFVGPAMLKFYTSCGVDADDSIILNAINTGAINSAVEEYAKKFEQNYEEAKVSETLSHFNYADMPVAYKPLIAKYKDKKIADLAEEADKNKASDAAKLFAAIQELTFRHMQKTLWGKLVDETIKKSLEARIS